MDTLPLPYTLGMYAGTDRDFIVRWEDDNGVDIDLTGYTAEFVLNVDTCSVADFTKAGVIAAPTTGEIIFPFTAADLDSLIIDCKTTCYHMAVNLFGAGLDSIALLDGTARIRKKVAL